jgi:hypothetical protein
MALKLSTGLRDDLLGLVATVRGAIVGVGLAFVDGGGGADTITDSGNGFVTAGFAPGDILFVQGSTSNDSAVTGAVLTAVAAGTITFATGTVDTAEAGLAGTVIACARGGSIKDVFHDGVLRIYSGSQPTDADAAVTGTLLIEVTESAGAFVHGAFGNALEFGDAASGAIAKAAAETWQGTGLAAGTAGYFRICANPTDNGAASTTLPRIDGSVGTSGADLNMTSTTVAVGATYTIDTFQFTLPEYYGA